MFLKDAEFDSSEDEGAKAASLVRPVRLANLSTSSADNSPDPQRSTQYQERLSRARQQKAIAFRKSAAAGMVTPNSLDKSSRPGSAATPIVALEQEIEEMELEDEKHSQEAKQKEKDAAAARTKQQKQEYRFSEDTVTKVETPVRGGTRGGSAVSIEEESSEEEDDDEEEEEDEEREDASTQVLTPAAMAKRPGRGRTSSTSSWNEEEDDDIMDSAVRPAGLSATEESSAMTATAPNPYIPASIDTSDLRTFLMTPGPQGAMVQCYIQRRKTGMTRLFPTYEIYLKEGDKFLMAARKRKKNKSSNYLISLDKDDLSRNSGNFYGKLRSNFIGTEFILYDKGSNPDKKEDIEHVQTRAELGCILYKQNVLGSRGPRKMKVMVPSVDASGHRKELRPTRPDETMLERYKAAQNDDDVQILKNKPPKWNDQVGAYVLNFNGRVTRASVKNFQLYNPTKDPEAVLMQFGRVGKDAFTMDYQAPLCALQAFGIALSSFDYKIACE
mmetsp:Transcript_25362/g.76920  ORF Transcript_25362/g.76920 Transcript_25362/m.76920 type:complete len:500 (-) Transcript_25362:591-2090(-)